MNQQTFEYTHVVLKDTPYYLTGPQQGSPSDGELKAGTRVRYLGTSIGIPDYAPSSAKPWDCKTSGNQRVGAFRRLFALSVASIPARVATHSHLPRACTTCSKRGFTGAWQGTRG